MKINRCQTTVEVECQCENCGKEFSQTFYTTSEDEAYVEALMSDCPHCSQRGIDRQDALTQVFG